MSLCGCHSHACWIWVNAFIMRGRSPDTQGCAGLLTRGSTKAVTALPVSSTSRAMFCANFCGSWISKPNGGVADARSWAIFSAIAFLRMFCRKLWLRRFALEQPGLAHRLLDGVKDRTFRQARWRLDARGFQDTRELHRNLHAGMGVAGRLACAVHDILERINPCLDLLRLFQVAGQHRGIELYDLLRNERGETHQRAINPLHHRGEKIFVVASKDRDIRIGVFDDMQIARIFVHIARADLHALDPGQMRELCERLEIVRGPCPCRIDMDDEIKPCALADGAEVIDDIFRLLHAEPEPLVRRHDQQGAGAGVTRHLRVLDRIGNPLTAYARDYWELPLNPLSDNARALGALFRREREDLAGVAVGDKAANALVAGQPGGKVAQLRLINRQLGVERALHGRKDTLVDR